MVVLLLTNVVVVVVVVHVLVCKNLRVVFQFCVVVFGDINMAQIISKRWC